MFRVWGCVEGYVEGLCIGFREIVLWKATSQERKFQAPKRVYCTTAEALRCLLMYSGFRKCTETLVASWLESCISKNSYCRRNRWPGKGANAQLG